MPTHSFGYKPSKPDARDLLYRTIAPTAVALPPSVDLRSQCSPVRDQGQLGSCTGFAIAVGMREFLENATPTPPTPPSPGCSLASLLPKFITRRFKLALTPLSPLFLYYEERVLEGTVGVDAGAEPRDGFKVLNQMGCAKEVDWPYDISRFTVAPPDAAVKSAGDYKVAAYHRLTDLTDAKTCLAGGAGFVLGFYVYSSFESIGANGKMPMPASGEQVIGGHAVFAAGYFDDPSWAGGGYLVVKNSWGIDWGDHGYFYMPYAYVTADRVPDLWTATV
jgi:C1A family cysteine protease